MSDTAVKQAKRNDGSRGSLKKRAVSIVVAGIVIVGIVAIVAVAVTVGMRSGLLVPGDAAARYADGEYISESAVTDYIASYRLQQGLEGGSDEMWASFLAENDLTPETLRVRTIQQLVIDAMVQKAAYEADVSVDESVFQEYLETFKGNLAFGDDDIYRQTLANQGQTVEQAEQGFRNLFLQQALFEKVVPVPEPTDEQIQRGLANVCPAGYEAKHICRFTIKGLDDEGGYEKLGAVQGVRRELLDSGLSQEAFKDCVQRYSNDTMLIEAAGDDGWSVDVSDRSDGYQREVEELGEGEVSTVFEDGEGYSFIWIDRTYTFTGPAADGAYDTATIPDDLLVEVADGIAQQLWQLDCQAYLQALLTESDLEVYPMPSDVPYNVDMSLADVQLEEVEP